MNQSASFTPDIADRLHKDAISTGVLGKFTEDHLALAIAIAHQAALAVEETHYHQAMLQAERLAAIGQTIAALSHHIKNILQGLRSGSEILKMGLKDKNESLIQQGSRLAEKNQGKIYDLVMDMLNYSKERIPAVEPTDLNEIVKEIYDFLTPLAPREHQGQVRDQSDRKLADRAGGPRRDTSRAFEYRRQCH